MQTFPPSIFFAYLNLRSIGVHVFCTEFFQISEEERYSAIPMEPSLEASLLQVNLDLKRSSLDAPGRAHGEPAQYCPPDRASLNALPSQSYYESFEERPADSMMKADHVESVRQQELQEALRPAPARQMILHLDHPLTIQAKRGLLSSLSNTAEDLQFWVVSNCWWLAADAPTCPSPVFRP